MCCSGRYKLNLWQVGRSVESFSPKHFCEILRATTALSSFGRCPNRRRKRRGEIQRRSLLSPRARTSGSMSEHLVKFHWRGYDTNYIHEPTSLFLIPFLIASPCIPLKSN